MQFIVYKGTDLVPVLNFLNQLGYNLTEFYNYWNFIINPDGFKILVNIENKSFTLFSKTTDILPIVKGKDVKSFDDFNAFANALGFTNNVEFHTNLHPGYYVVIDKGDSLAYGIVIDTKHILYFDKKGSNVKYLANFTDTEPYKIIKICKPSDIYYQAKDIDMMDIVWQRPKDKVKRSIADIEKALNLEPGTLEIYE